MINLRLPSNQMISGLHIIEEFITNEEETNLLDSIYSPLATWNDTIKRRTQHYGYIYDYSSRNALTRTTPLPSWQTNVQRRVENAIEAHTGTNRMLEQLIINEYTPGQGIAAHIDSVSAFGDVVAALSLKSAVNMIFKSMDTNDTNDTINTIEVRLLPRTLALMTGDARYKYTHCIPARKSDTVDGRRIPRSTRCSMTWRQKR